MRQLAPASPAPQKAFLGYVYVRRLNHALSYDTHRCSDMLRTPSLVLCINSAAQL